MKLNGILLLYSLTALLAFSMHHLQITASTIVAGMGADKSRNATGQKAMVEEVAGMFALWRGLGCCKLVVGAVACAECRAVDP